MKKILVLMVMSVIGTIFYSAAATPPDLNDNVLVAYRLNADEEASFANNPGTAMTAFWGDWETQNAGSLTLDYIHMNSADPKYARNINAIPFSGPNDADIVIKAAYGQMGLYVYTLVTNDQWVECSGGYSTDIVDLYFDATSSSAINSPDAAASMVYPDWAQLTMTSQQFQVCCGGADVPKTISYNYYDLTLYDWSENVVPLTDIASTYDGLTVRILKLSDTQKAQEWLIPWSRFGMTSKPEVGTQMGLSGGFNDLDADMVVGSGGNQLRWIQHLDPWAGTIAKIGNCWGDIEIASVPVTGVISGIHSKNIRPAAVVRSEYFNIRGEKIAAMNNGIAKADNMIIEREVLKDGSVVTRMAQAVR